MERKNENELDSIEEFFADLEECVIEPAFKHLSLTEYNLIRRQLQHAFSTGAFASLVLAQRHTYRKALDDIWNFSDKERVVRKAQKLLGSTP